MERNDNDYVAEKRADATREARLRKAADADPAARKLGMDAVRKMTDGQDRDVQDEETVEEVAGPIHVSTGRELSPGELDIEVEASEPPEGSESES